MIQHLFFLLSVRSSRLGYNLCSLGTSYTYSVDDMFGHWLDGIRSNLKPLILLGASALCWSLWLCRNAFIFENKHTSFLQVIYLTMHWLRTWAVRQKSSSQEVVVAASQYLAQVAKEFFYPGT